MVWIAPFGDPHQAPRIATKLYDREKLGKMTIMAWGKGRISTIFWRFAQKLFNERLSPVFIRDIDFIAYEKHFQVNLLILLERFLLCFM